MNDYESYKSYISELNRQNEPERNPHAANPYITRFFDSGWRRVALMSLIYGGSSAICILIITWVISKFGGIL